MGGITSYKLSDIAEKDISSIYDYTATQHGGEQAIKYLTGLDNSFASLVEHPEIGKIRSEIRLDLRSFIFEHHVIFYRLHHDYVRIVRVLHKSSDMPRFLNDL